MPNLLSRTTAISLELTDYLYIIRSPYEETDDRKVLVQNLFNTTNLQLTAGKINTVQDIDVLADPQFQSLALNINPVSTASFTVKSASTNSLVFNIIRSADNEVLARLQENSSGGALFFLQDASAAPVVFLSTDAAQPSTFVNDVIFNSNVSIDTTNDGLNIIGSAIFIDLAASTSAIINCTSTFNGGTGINSIIRCGSHPERTAGFSLADETNTDMWFIGRRYNGGATNNNLQITDGSGSQALAIDVDRTMIIGSGAPVNKLDIITGGALTTNAKVCIQGSESTILPAQLTIKLPQLTIFNGETSTVNNPASVCTLATSFTNSAGQENFYGLYTTRSTSAALAGSTYTAVQSGDNLGKISWGGDDGTDLRTEAATLVVAVDGAVSSNTIPGRMLFNLNSGGALTERMRLLSNGTLLLGTTSETGGYLLEVNGDLLADNVLSGTYTPTVTNVANVDAGASAAILHHYIRIGNEVTVSGGATITPSGTEVTFSFNVTLPITSDLGAPGDGVGSGFAYENNTDANQTGIVAEADGTNDLITIIAVEFGASLTVADTFFCRYEFKYIIQ